ncbi:MAG TPA: sensor histidine kinase [Gemmatimonadaceae bacterium]|nr:sensor histidine kinase [Gemmatimonadaceae bacterium]
MHHRSADGNRLGPILAARLREARTELTARWLERILARVDVEPSRVFPSDELLDHIPLLLLSIADVIEDPSRTPAANAAVIAHSRELGALRHEQGFGEQEILKEFHILGGILFTFVERVAGDAGTKATNAEVVACTHRLFDALTMIQQTTALHYLALARQKVLDREDRLRAFNRMVTHEFRNRIGAALGATESLLELPALEASERARLAAVARRSVREMSAVLDGLLELTQGEGDIRQQRHVRLPEAAREAARQLRDTAAAEGVELRVRGDLPDVEVNAATVELCLINLIGNSIKYGKPAAGPRWIEVRGRHAGATSDGQRSVVVEVADNGPGVPTSLGAAVFDRFVRGGEAPNTVGSGLGLSIVREAVERLGGRAWLENSPAGAVFAFSLPARRREDAPLALVDERASADGGDGSESSAGVSAKNAHATDEPASGTLHAE